MKYRHSRYEIILADHEIFLLSQKCEIKFASKHLRSKYFIRVSVFHSGAISLAVKRISLKKKRQVFRLVFLFSSQRSKRRKVAEKLILILFGDVVWCEDTENNVLFCLCMRVRRIYKRRKADGVLQSEEKFRRNLKK